MKNIFKLSNALFLLSIIIVSCGELVHEQSTLSGDESIMTRASNFEATGYYLCDGRKIAIQEMNSKFFVMFYSAEESSFVFAPDLA